MFTATNKATENTLMFWMHRLLRKIEVTLKKKYKLYTKYSLFYHYVSTLERGQIENKCIICRNLKSQWNSIGPLQLTCNDISLNNVLL